MDSSTFNRLTQRLSGASRRGVLRALIFAATAIRLTPVRIARAQAGGSVPRGEPCASATECRQEDMRGEAICADNGFTSDGPFNCCANDGCCASDAECCGDLRCAPTGDVCSVCRQPPFPTRQIGQACDGDDDCVTSVTCAVACIRQRCACGDAPDGVEADDRPALPVFPDAESALDFVEWLSRLEGAARYDIIYRTMHPDARAFIPDRAVVNWYRRDSPTLGAEEAEATKVRFISWTWGVTGMTYPNTAEVAFRQTLADGTELRDEVRLVKDAQGNWGWFFGRERAFVEEQIERYGEEQ